jgi:hypothetical protein
MLYYKSSIGCVEYYDDVECEPLLCDPTMLFILGLEAVTTPQEEYYKEVPVIDSDTHNPVIDTDTGLPVTEIVVDVIRLRQVVIYKDRINNDDIYNKVIKYFSIHGKPKEFEDRVEFYCAGLRQFMNQLTGTDSSRITPVIFHDIIEFSTLGVENDSDYNEIYEKITNVLNNAGCKNQIYKKLDIKSMYSYALGVLFGCICLGYNFDSIWGNDSSEWYDGDYDHLVSSAKNIFSFYYFHQLCCVDIDPKLHRKYHSIQDNKIWNFPYVPTGKTISLYKNIVLLFKGYEYLDDGIRYILNDSSTEIHYGFVSLDSLYESDGITEYTCSIVEEDQYGNPLVDLDGNYIAWYDSKVNKYWNGYTKMWQDEVPTKAEELPQGEMTLYLVQQNSSQFSNGNYSIPIIDSTAKPASVTCFDGYYSDGGFTATSKLTGVDGNSLSFTIDNYYDNSKSVTIYYDGSQVFSRTVGRLDYTRLDEIENDYISFSGSWPRWGGPHGWIHSRTYYLLSGVDNDTLGIPLYYEDGTQAKISDYIPYKITSLNSRIYRYISTDWAAMKTGTSSISIDVSKLSFTSDSSGNLLLSYSGDQHIIAMIGFKFSWAYKL